MPRLAKLPVKIMLATYFGAVGDNLACLAGLPVAGVHVDLVRAPEQLEEVCRALPADRVLSLGLVDGRNIWKTALTDAERLIEQARTLRGDALMVGAKLFAAACAGGSGRRKPGWMPN